MRICSISVLSVVVFACHAALAADTAAERLIGVWLGSGRASEAIYGTLTISDKYISWPRTNNLQSCKTSYEIISTEISDTFPDEFPTHVHSVKGRVFTTVKLKLGEENCLARSLGQPAAFLQFSFPSDMPGFAYVVEYDKAGKPHSELAFNKSQ